MSTNLSPSHEPIGQVHCDMKRFCLQPKPYMDIDQPINEYSSHMLINFNLGGHVVRCRIELGLLLTAPSINAVSVFNSIERNKHDSFLTNFHIFP